MEILAPDEMRKRLQKALDYGGNCFTIEDVIDFTKRGLFQCFYNEKAIVFTQVCVFPRCKMLDISIVAGEQKAVISLFPQIILKAKEFECVRLTSSSPRRGWKKIAEGLGFTQTFICYEKTIGL